MKNKRHQKIHFVKAIKFIRRLRGGSQPCLLQCNDDSYYVTKMFGNPQGPNVLANEWIGTAMARSVGLPVPDSAIVEISESFVNENPDLFFQLGRERRRPKAGIHFGSAFVREADDINRVLDRLTYSQTICLKQGPAFTGITLLDLLAELQDHRQMVYSGKDNRTTHSPTFIDFGDYCLGANWERSTPKSGPFRYAISAFPRLWENKSVIDGWLYKFQRSLPEALSDAVSSMPHEWYFGDLVKVHSHYQMRIENFAKIATSFLLAEKPAYSIVPSRLNERRAFL